jgi:MFS transporter, DHA2 family, methylenomycin A resistance protein
MVKTKAAMHSQMLHEKSPANRTINSVSIGWITTAASFGFVVVQLDVTIVNVALQRISTDLHASMAALQWVVDAYALVFAVLLLSAGVLGDRFGAKRSFSFGFFLFAVASLGCGMAPNAPGLIASRALQGVGAALLVPSSLALLNHACEDDARRRAHAIALWTASGGVSIAAGPVVGGLLLSAFGWRSIFLVNLPVCLVGFLLTHFFASETKRHNRNKHLDLSGQFLAIVSLSGLTAAVIESRPLGFSSSLVIGGMILALFGGILLVIHERRIASPMLPLEFFSHPRFNSAVIFGVLVNSTYYGIIFILSLYLQRARGFSTIQAGLAFLPLTATFIFSNIASGWVSSRFGLRIPMAVGSLIGATGFALLFFFTDQTSFGGMLPAFALIPLGIGLAVPAMTTAILSSVDRIWSGTASAVLNAARQAGGAIGVAVFGALTNGEAAHQIISGLQVAAIISAGMLIAGSLISWIGIGRE